jgi:sugar (glycoside-pentoside-hexuronide) transporter
MEKIKAKEKWAYSFGALGNNLVYGLIATFLVKFYTDYLLLPALSITGLFLVARIWDGVNDPIMGYLVDKTNSKRGRFRPYLLFTPWIVGLFTILCFVNPGLSTGGNIAWAYITYILFGMAFTAMDIPYWSMTPAISQDITERSKIVTMSRTIASIGYFIGMVAAYPVMTDAFGGGNVGWLMTAVVFAALGIIFTLIAYANTHERYTVERKEKYTIKTMLAQFKINTPLWVLMVALFFVEVANAVKIIFPTYYFENNLQNGGLITIFLALYALCLIAGSVVCPWFIKKMGKRKTAILGISLMGVFSIMHYFFGYRYLPAIFATNAFSAFGFGLSNIAMMSMLADTVEYGQWKSGVRAEGMVFSTNIFKTKVGTAIGGMIGTLGLALFLYVPNTAQSIFTLNGIHLMITLIPGILALIGIIPLMKYGISEEVYQNILVDLSNNHSQ